MSEDRLDTMKLYMLEHCIELCMYQDLAYDKIFEFTVPESTSVDSNTLFLSHESKHREYDKSSTVQQRELKAVPRGHRKIV